MSKTGGFLVSLEKNDLLILLFLLPSQFGYHLWPGFAHIFGIRVDYLSPTIYVTDLLLLSLFFLWAAKGPKIPKSLLLGLVATTVFAVINISLAVKIDPAMVKWLKILELSFFSYYIYSLSSLDLKKQVIRPLSLSIIFFSLLAIAQFFLQRTVGGPLYFLGERSFSASTPGIALVNFFGKEYLRAYSTFSHPNSLAGFLGASMFILFAQRAGKNARLKTFSLILGLFTFFLTFSLGAYLGLLSAGIFYLIIRNFEGYSKRLTNFVFLGLMLLSVIMPVLAGQLVYKGISFREDVYDRVVLSEAAGRIFSSSPLWGIGLNNFIIKLPEVVGSPHLSWWLQPVHNIFLLILSESGIVGLIFFSYLILRALKKALELKRLALFLSLIFIVVTGSIDHYWLTLQQNQLLFSLVLGLSLRNTN